MSCRCEIPKFFSRVAQTAVVAGVVSVPLRHSTTKPSKTKTSNKLTKLMNKQSIIKSAIILVGGSTILAGNLGAAQSFNKSRTFSTGGEHFAASASVQAFDNYTPGVDYALTLRSDATAKVFGVSKEVAKAEAIGSVNYVTKLARAQGSLRAFGQSLINYDRTFPSSGTFRTASFSRSLNIADARFFLGPVPIRVTAGGSLSIFGEVSYAITQSANSPIPTFEGKARAPFDIAAKASASIDVIVAEAGLRGSLSLVGSEIKAEAKVFPGFLNGVYANYKVSWETKSMAGKLELFATVGIWPLDHTFTYELASFAGLTNNVVIHEGRVTLKSPLTLDISNTAFVPAFTALK